MIEVEKKEIEEMEKIITDSINKDCLINNGGHCSDCKYNDKNQFNCEDANCQSMWVAERFYNAGYGKVENYKEQLETDKEYEKNLNNVINKQLAEIADYKKEIERLNKQNKALMQGQIDCVNEGQKEIERLKDINQTLITKYNEKQAIKEFAEKLIDFCEDKKQEFSKPCKSKREENADMYRHAGVVWVENKVYDLLKVYGVDLEKE